MTANPEPLSISCNPDPAGWTCTVIVGETTAATEHRVSVSTVALERLAPGEPDPATLVEASFRFLLEREPRESILRQFSIEEIERYFPDYARIIRRLEA